MRELEQEREERRRGVSELTDALAQGNAAMERMQREAGERDMAVHALKLAVEWVVQIAPCKLELVAVKAALAALKERVHGLKTAAEREMHQVREQRGRELAEVKQELAAVRREVCENKSASQRKLNEIRNVIGVVEHRNGCTAASMVEREKELAAVKLQVAELSEFSEGKLATASQDLSQQIIAEVDEIRMKFQERNAKIEAVLKRTERECAAVKQQLAEFRMAAKQEANELRDIVGALQEGSEDGAAMVREEGGRELIKQGCEAVWNRTAKGGHREGAGRAIWQRLESPSGKTRLDLSSLSGLSDDVLALVSTMTHLTALNLAGSSGFTAKGISCLNKLLWLQKLHLSGTTVSDEHLKGIEALSRLECLSLANTKVTDSGLVNLVKLPSLKRLELAGCSCVTSAGMAHVGKITTLKQVDLRRTGVADNGLQQLTSLLKLEELLLSSGRVMPNKEMEAWQGDYIAGREQRQKHADKAEC
ncbi:unnamed protein product [Closterium sp. Yama58-4]|nr:unnamed protein product [Closterium sp. Yama58-4]